MEGLKIKKEIAKIIFQDTKLTRLKWRKYLHNALVSSLLRSTFCRLWFIQYIELVTSQHAKSISNHWSSGLVVSNAYTVVGPIDEIELFEFELELEQLRDL